MRLIVRRIAASLAMFLMVATSAHVPAAEAPKGEVLPAVVEGTALVVLRSNGTRVEGQALVGAVVVGGDAERGGRAMFRIDGLRSDFDDPEITLYDLSARDPATGAWSPYCTPDSRGVAGAVFLADSWDAHGTHLHDGRFSVACTSGAIGKCVRAGYKPWKTMPDGRPGRDYHQACTRLVRADYCGDGISHTREGVRIEIIDRLGQAEEPGSDLTFEAGWTPAGASCVARARLGGPLGLLATQYSARLEGRLGAACTLTGELAKPEVLLVNKSLPTSP